MTPIGSVASQTVASPSDQRYGIDTLTYFRNDGIERRMYFIIDQADGQLVSDPDAESLVFGFASVVEACAKCDDLNREAVSAPTRRA